MSKNRIEDYQVLNYSFGRGVGVVYCSANSTFQVKRWMLRNSSDNYRILFSVWVLMCKRHFVALRRDWKNGRDRKRTSTVSAVCICDTGISVNQCLLKGKCKNIYMIEQKKLPWKKVHLVFTLTCAVQSLDILPTTICLIISGCLTLLASS